MTDSGFSIFKKVIVLAMAIFFINCGFVFAADSTIAPSGTATQPSINQRGSDIIDVGNLSTSSIDANSATVTGAMKAGSVSAGAVSASSVSTSGTVSAGTVSAPAGAITNLNTNRTCVQRTPTSPVDATNKSYVDGKISSLQSQINALGSSSGCPSGLTLQAISWVNSNGNQNTHYSGYFCVKNFSVGTNTNYNYGGH